MRNHRLGIWLPILLLGVRGFAAPEDLWFRSNAAGMALESSLSRFAALRNKYALSITAPEAAELPGYLQEFYDPSFRIELHTLYEEGTEFRRQWIFKDESGITRLVSSGDIPPDPSDGEGPAAGTEDAPAEAPPDSELEEEPGAEASVPEDGAGSEGISFFIEIYDENNLITEEYQFSGDGTEYITRYFYNDILLIRAETHLKQADPEGEGEKIEPLTTDYYRYSRSKSLRAVERIYHQPLPEDNYQVRLTFPGLVLDAAGVRDFVRPGTAYESEFLQDVFTEITGQINYVTDERGKVLVETISDEEGNPIGEIRNTWSGDRLVAVEWKSAEEERRSEYDFDEEGDRIAERNYRNGVLERVVRRENGRETEELYMNGEMILRAIWEEGRKISEEYFSPQKREGNW
ncbi:MAG: hypothetical protein LBT93_07210 [Treponema sp.]|nr:hypothetical protein [Treponema sp.]